jgi:putative colanic acid biosynthesis UDP-glucose lipid carrier transferase
MHSGIAEEAQAQERARISRISVLFPVAEALLAAAHSDRPPSNEEHAVIRRLLCELLGVQQLPLRLEARIAAFDPSSVDLQALARNLLERPVMGRKSLIELTREVCDADGSLDLDEDRYMLALSLALSLDPAEVDHVVFDSPFKGLRRTLKRIEDIILGTIFLLICAVPMLFIAAAIKITSPGPVFFRQRRHGENGREFGVLKFRSMTVMENGGAVVQATKNDSRITPVGAFIRRTSLDELPQFINVIMGDMSIVGPRPHAIAHNELYRQKILEYMRRHKVKPGITGWAQVNGLRGETDTPEKMARRVQFDLYYIDNWSLLFYIKILMLTPFLGFVNKNAY